MERLTKKDEYGNADIIAISDIMPEIYAGLSFSETNALTKALNRLAAYEDTGLTPKEVKLIANVLREVGETYNCWFNYVAQCVIEHSKLKKLAQAERGGRLVVLPDGDDTAALAATIDSTDMIRVWSGGDSGFLMGLLSMLVSEVAQKAGTTYRTLLIAMMLKPPIGDMIDTGLELMEGENG